ncbi:DUF2225 domain-containing protein [Desulforamulus aquiferis]|uniref:DUF2225 domain-containing protein n=1 Tax=Desulforamulus aquiferis TaxID=1397668 RepID=A0AAW7ZHI1_9FIRM|nr:DUF2225 domain-containing protein [Desulforamulus aquiferis]MDO7788481.1 DUF2225 domain-containing protein [Desulforamulus aquiferis]
MNKHQDMIFPIKLTCPNCEKEFEHPEVKSKYIVIERQDRDFCSYFAGINPLFYDIMVCKYCGFAFTRETNIPLSEPEKAIIKTILANWHTDGYQYGGVRTLDMAIKAYNLAIVCQELRNAKDSVKGSLYLRLGWLYRYQGNKVSEEKSLQRALEFMKRAYERESTNELKKELRMIYLLGELSHRMGNEREAIQWLQTVISHKEVKRYPIFERMARSLWQDIREQHKK